MRRNYGLILSIVCGLMFGGASANAADPFVLNDKVIEYCKSNLEKMVGNGECAGLGVQALKAAGAKTRAGPDAPHERDYVWGKQVYMLEATANGLKETGKLSDTHPGDIIQFRDVGFGDKVNFAHHTAILAEVAAEAKGKVVVYQQNAGGRRFVFKAALHKFEDLKEGYIIIYRPVPEH